MVRGLLITALTSAAVSTPLLAAVLAPLVARRLELADCGTVGNRGKMTGRQQ